MPQRPWTEIRLDPALSELDTTAVALLNGLRLSQGHLGEEIDNNYHIAATQMAMLTAARLPVPEVLRVRSRERKQAAANSCEETFSAWSQRTREEPPYPREYMGQFRDAPLLMEEEHRARRSRPERRPLTQTAYTVWTGEEMRIAHEMRPYVPPQLEWAKDGDLSGGPAGPSALSWRAAMPPRHSGKTAPPLVAPIPTPEPPVPPKSVWAWIRCPGL